MLHPKTDIGGHLKVVAAGAVLVSSAPDKITAAGAGDNTKITGQTINNINGGLSGVLVTNGVATLTEAKVLKLAIEIQESADGSNWDTAEVLQAATTVATGGAGGSTNYFAHKLEVDLKKRKQYVRFNVTPDLDASGTDLATVHWSLIVGGDDVLDAA